MQQLIQLRVANLAVDMTMDFPVAEANRFAHYGSPFEPDLVQALIKILRPGDVVIDGGANIGCVSLAMAALVGDKGKVYAFEPGEDNLVGLRCNVLLNDLSHIVEIVDRPLWSSEEKVTLYYSRSYGVEHSLADLGDETFKKREMTATTIDTALYVSPRLIKLDIEGAEIEALIGAWSTIRSSLCYVICEMNQWTLERFGNTCGDLYGFAKEHFGYDTWMLTKWHPYPVLMPRGVHVTSTKTPNFNVLMATQEMVAAAYPEMNYDAQLEYI